MSGVYYVYELIDPRNSRVFYVGKGTGRRASRHTHYVRNGASTDNPYKDAVIRQILDAGLEPIINYVVRNLDEEAAYARERDLIVQYGRRAYGEGILTNLCVDAKPPRRTGPQNHFYGKTWEEAMGPEKADALRRKMAERTFSEEALRSISDKAKARYADPGYSLHMRLVKLGRRRSEESRAAQSRAISGTANHQFGKTHSEAARTLMSQNHADFRGSANPKARTFALTSPDGVTYRVTGGLEAFCRLHNFDFSTVWKALKEGSSPTRGRFAGWSARRVLPDQPVSGSEPPGDETLDDVPCSPPSFR